MSESIEPAQDPVGLAVHTQNQPGVLHRLSGVISEHGGDITWVAIQDSRNSTEWVYFEVLGVGHGAELVEALEQVDSVIAVESSQSLRLVFGKRIIIIGGGAQVGQVAIGAVGEADRHNLRGERISVDTIPLVGEGEIAEAVRAVARLPRARCVVLAGAIMGGEIETAVRAVQARGLLVVSLNMAGSVVDAADLVVTDPVQAGVMAVMAVADTARFDVARSKKRRF